MRLLKDIKGLVLIPFLPLNIFLVAMVQIGKIAVKKVSSYGR